MVITLTTETKERIKAAEPSSDSSAIARPTYQGPQSKNEVFAVVVCYIRRLAVNTIAKQ